MNFETLLQQAQKLTNETHGTEEFPRVERTLPQVLQATNELHQRVTQTGAQDIQAYVYFVKFRQMKSTFSLFFAQSHFTGNSWH